MISLHLPTANTDTGTTKSVIYKDIIKVLTRLLVMDFGLTNVRPFDGNVFGNCACLLFNLWCLFFICVTEMCEDDDDTDANAEALFSDNEQNGMWLLF